MRPRLASNCVGGDSALRLMDALAPAGTLVTFGSMSRRSVKVPNSWLIFKGLSLQGLWCTHWLGRVSREEIVHTYGLLSGYVADGTLVQAVDSVYSLAELDQAVCQAKREGRNGKVLLRLSF